MTANANAFNTLGRSAASIDSSQLGQTLLGPNKFLFTPSDGKSVAWITRTSMSDEGSGKTLVDGALLSFGSAIDAGASLPAEFELAPDEARQARITFRLPPGTYEFVAGYGGGVHDHKSLASNAVSFNVSGNGTVTLAK